MCILNGIIQHELHISSARIIIALKQEGVPSLLQGHACLNLEKSVMFRILNLITFDIEKSKVKKATCASVTKLMSDRS